MSESKALIKVPNKLTGLSNNKIRDVFRHYEGQITEMVKGVMTPDRFIAMAVSVIASNPKIKECTTASILGAVFQAAQLGLEVQPQLGHVSMVPFRNKGVPEVQFILGYKGKIELAYRTGRVTYIKAMPIYENDEFTQIEGTDSAIIHKPVPLNQEKGKLTGAYAVAKIDTGATLFNIIDLAEIEDARERSKSKNSSFSPWNTDYVKMARKTAVHRLMPYVPVRVENKNLIAEAMKADEQVIRYEDGQFEIEEDTTEDKVQQQIESAEQKEIGFEDEENTQDKPTKVEYSENVTKDNPLFDDKKTGKN